MSWAPADRIRRGLCTALVPLLLMGAGSALAQQVTSDVVEAIVVDLAREEIKSEAWADSMWKAHGVDPPERPETVFVLNREHLEQMAGMSLRDVEDLMRALHRRGVPARWCQVKCPLHGGDQTVTIKWAMPVRQGRLVVEAEVYGLHPREEFDPSALTAWMHRVSFDLVKRGHSWRVIASGISYWADYSGWP